MGGSITLFALCMFKIMEPSVYRLIQAKYQRPVQWIQTGANEPFLKGRHSFQNRSFAAAEASMNESSPITLTSKTQLGDINRVDTNVLKCISGIGSLLANRIVKLRSYHGFYVHMDQLKDVYLLPDSVYLKFYKQFTLDLSNVKRFSINTSTKEELMRLSFLNSKGMGCSFRGALTEGRLQT